MSAETLRSNPISLRTVILFHFSQGMEIFDGYKRFCRVLGDNCMDYPEYEYWWMRFARKEFDLDYDRSQDPVTRKFEDLTPAILREVMKNLSLEETVTLGQVSQNLRDVSDSFAVTHQEAIIKFDGPRVSLTIDDKEYVNKVMSEIKNDYRFKFGFDDRNDEEGKISESCINHIKEGIVEMEKFLLHPKVKFEKKFELVFELPTYGHYTRSTNGSKEYNKTIKTMFINFVTGINQHVTSVFFRHDYFICDIISILQPGKLEGIHCQRCAIADFSRFIKMDQFKQATSVRIPDQNRHIPFKLLSHLKRFEIGGRVNGNLRNMRKLVAAIFRGDFPKFEKCTVKCHDDNLYVFEETWDAEFGLTTVTHNEEMETESHSGIRRQNEMTLKITMTTYDDHDNYSKLGFLFDIEKIN